MDAAVWLRCLAQRYSDGTGAAAAAATLAPEVNSLGATNELRALADAADALAQHPVSCSAVISPRSAAAATPTVVALRWSVARNVTSAARIAPHVTVAAAAAAVSSGTASVLQLAAWRRANPSERGRGARVHPVVDALAATLTAFAALEDALLCSLCVVAVKVPTATSSSTATATAAAAAAAAQDWRLRLESVAASTPAPALCFAQDGTPPDGAAVEAVTVAYVLARKAITAAANAAAVANAGNVSVSAEVAPGAAAATPARAWETWQHAAGRMDLALGGKPYTLNSKP